MWVRRSEYDRLVAETVEARAMLSAERERNRVREEALVDRVLTHNGSRPVTPAIVEERPQAQQTELSYEQNAFRDDWMLELAQYRYGAPSLEVLGPEQRRVLMQQWEAFTAGTFDPDDVRPV